MNNYFGIGLDAKISLDFNNKRDEHPEKCRWVALGAHALRVSLISPLAPEVIPGVSGRAARCALGPGTNSEPGCPGGSSGQFQRPAWRRAPLGLARLGHTQREETRDPT